MFSERVLEALKPIAQRVAELAREDERLRNAILQLAGAITGTEVLLKPPEPAVEREDEPAVEQARVEAPEAAPTEEPPSRVATAAEESDSRAEEAPSEDGRPAPPEDTLPAEVAIERLWPEKPPEERLGERPSPQTAGQRWEAPSNAELAIVQQRCRLKAEGCRWAATRQRWLADGADYRSEIQPLDRDLISRANGLPDCFLWMNHPHGPAPEDLSHWERVARCFETLDNAIGVIRPLLDDPQSHQDLFERSLDLVAEAQSALRRSIVEIDAPPDSDQARVFNWLRQTTSEHQIFIQRYMRADDAADPDHWDDIARRIDELDSEAEETRRGAKLRRKRFGKLRYVTGEIAGSPDEDHERHWRTLLNTVQELVEDGLPPSNRELRDLLIRVVDHFPDVGELPEAVQSVLREIDRFLSVRPSDDGAAPVQEPSEEVREVAELLRGRSVVLIGGDRRPHAAKKLEEAFDLEELYWLATREHESVETFEPYIARDDVALVLLAIRWSSHSYGDVQRYCERYGKPLVRLPAGYNPNQVAAHVQMQCSQRLAEHA